MIRAHDGRWTICTPTKCGTYSLEATLVERLSVAEKLVPRHQCEKTHAVGERIMVVRHPYDRWASMWWFIVQHGAGKIWCGDFSHDINAFVTEWNYRRRERPNWMWTENLAYHHRHFEPATVFKLETNSYVDLLRYLFEKYEVPLVKVSHKNVTRERRTWQETFDMLTPVNLDIVKKFCEPDIALWYAG